MAGFNNDVVFAKNGDFTSATNTAPSESNGLATDGQLWIGTTAVNAGNTHINVGNLTSPNSSITFGYSSPNITATVNPSVIQDLHTARYIVSAGGLPNGANYTTIASAIAAAAGAGGNQTVFIQPGTYTENLTLSAGVNLSAYGCDITGIGYTTASPVTIVGKCTFTTAGEVNISNIELKTSSDFCLAVTGSAASIVNLTNCYINASNNTAISYTSSSSSSGVVLNNCTGNLATTGIAYFSCSGAGSFRVIGGLFANTGGSTTANSFTGTGGFFPNYCGFTNGTSIAGTSNTISGADVAFIMGNNQSALTLAGTTTTASLQNCTYTSNTSSAVDIGSGCSAGLHGAVIASSNANPITGSGTLTYTNIGFASATAINSTIIRNPFPTTSGWAWIQSQTASASATLDFTTGIGSQFSEYVIVFKDVKPATGGSNLWIRQSTNAGSSYAATGYVTGANYNIYNSATDTNTNSTVASVVTGPVSSAAGTGVSGMVFIGSANGVNFGQSAWIDNASGNFAFGRNGGGFGSSNTNALRVMFSSGNITSGTVTLYGLLA